MLDDRMARDILSRKNTEIKDKLRREKDRMERSIFEATKYYVDPTTRQFVPKGWGWEDWLWNSDLYCGKKIFVKKGKKCSWHYHKQKDETFTVLSGKLRLLYLLDDDEQENACEIVLLPGDVFHLPPGLRHQFFGLLDTEFVEISTKHIEEDTVRLTKGD